MFIIVERYHSFPNCTIFTKCHNTADIDFLWIYLCFFLFNIWRRKKLIFKVTVLLVILNNNKNPIFFISSCNSCKPASQILTANMFFKILPQLLKMHEEEEICGRHSFSVNLVVSEVCFSFLLIVKQFISSLSTVYVTLCAAVGSSVAAVVYWLPRNFLFLFFISYFSFAIMATNFNLAFKTKEKIVP